MSNESLKQRFMEASALRSFEWRSAHEMNAMPIAAMPIACSPVDKDDHNEFLRATSSVSSLASASSFARPSVLPPATTSATRAFPPSPITSLPMPPPMGPPRTANKMAISSLLSDHVEHGPPSRVGAAPEFPQYNCSPLSLDDDLMSPITSPTYACYRTAAAEEPRSQTRFSPKSSYQTSFERSASQDLRSRPVRSVLKRKSQASRPRPPVGESKSKRPWTEFEDAQLRTLTERLGIGLWAAIAEHIPFRTGKQVRERWLNHLSPEVHKRPWAPAEDRIIIEGHKKYGNSWSKICKLLEGRSENMCKNRFHCKLRKLHDVGGSSTDLRQ